MSWIIIPNVAKFDASNFVDTTDGELYLLVEFACKVGHLLRARVGRALNGFCW